MSVRNGFAVEIHGFMHSLRTFLTRAVHSAIAMEALEDRRRRQARERVQRYGRRLTVQQRGKGRQGPLVRVSIRAIHFAR